MVMDEGKVMVLDVVEIEIIIESVEDMFRKITWHFTKSGIILKHNKKMKRVTE